MAIMIILLVMMMLVIMMMMISIIYIIGGIALSSERINKLGAKHWRYHN